MPYDYQYQPVSIDLRLHPLAKAVMGNPSDPMSRSYVDISFPFRIFPGECLIASTLERITLPDIIVARVEGKSTLGRLFITVHHTAGLLDPGFSGQITLEIKNDGPAAFELTPDMLICQVVFEAVDMPVGRPYGSPGLNSHYQNQSGPTVPKL